MGTPLAHRFEQAIAVAALGVPGVLLAHLLTSGAAARPTPSASVAVVVLAVAAVRPVRTAAGLASVTAAAQVAGHSVLALAALTGSASAGCLPAVGRGASLGLHLALLRADVDCPAGTGVPDAASAPTTAAITAVLGALTILVGHALAAALTGTLLRAGRRSVRAVTRLSTVVAALPRRWRLILAAPRPTVPVSSRPWPVARRTEIRLTSQWRPGAVRRRGPPEAARRARRPVPLPCSA